jgi:hypothetical protein
MNDDNKNEDSKMSELYISINPRKKIRRLKKESSAEYACAYQKEVYLERKKEKKTDDESTSINTTTQEKKISNGRIPEYYPQAAETQRTGAHRRLSQAII